MYSNDAGISFEFGCRLREGIRSQLVEILRDSEGRVFKAFADVECAHDHCSSVESELMMQEVIRVLNFQAVQFHFCRWKVFEIYRYHRIAMRVNCGRDDVTVVWIRQVNRSNEMLVPLDKAIGNALVHERSRSFQFVARQVGAISK